MTSRDTSRRRLLAGFGLGWLMACGACSARAVERPPQGPRLRGPTAAIPPDLQLTLRIALRRVRAAIGAPALLQLQRDSQLGAALTEPLLTHALGMADNAWAAIRLGQSPEHTDNVLVLEGDFSDLEASSERWSIADDLGSGWQRRDRLHETPRAMPARVYLWGTELLVFVSEAEIDAVERVLERGVQVEMIEPPARGLVAIAASMPALAHLLTESAPRAASLLAKGRALTGYADFEQGTGVLIALSFEFADAEQAERSAKAASLLVGALGQSQGPLSDVARVAQIEAVAESVAVRLRLPPSMLVRWFACDPADGACS